jgi:uncharacterized protein with FMN-binding domain
MRRSPIVLAATIAGTAGIQAFHAHTPGLQSATASTATVTATPTATSTASATTTATATAAGVSGTATGAAIDTRYGTAQVKVTVKNGKIVSLQAVQLQSNDPRSQQISSSAEPVLQQEVLSRQTANVDAVSGASYTSASYLQSVQSALNKLGYKAPDGSVATLQVPS